MDLQDAFRQTCRTCGQPLEPVTAHDATPTTPLGQRTYAWCSNGHAWKWDPDKERWQQSDD